MRGDKFRRRVREPLGKRQILVIAALEHFQEFQVVAAGVFDVMRQRLLYVAHVTGFKVHCSRAASCGEHGHAPLAADEELPFVSIGMPVQLAQTTGLQGDQRGGDILRDLEIARVNDAHLAALCALCRRLLHGAKGKIDRRGSQCSRRPALDRKSTRLNSSHGYISYAAFCLKKKKDKISVPRLSPSHWAPCVLDTPQSLCVSTRTVWALV